MSTKNEDTGHEARVKKNDHIELKLWLRLFSCSTQIEDQIKQRLRDQFQISLARFDYMAQLYREPHGLNMGDLSNNLMVTKGNITGLTDELENDGLVIRQASLDDRRSWVIKLTPTGNTQFSKMAQEHEKWILEFFSEIEPNVIQQMYQVLGTIRQHVTHLSQPVY
jgi:DNA-binding MarR family transcriptional regulator